VHYDPLLAKLVAHAETRETAIARAAAALRAYPILGLHTNVAFLLRLLEHPAFREGHVDTAFVDEGLDELTAVVPPPDEAIAAAGWRRPRAATLTSAGVPPSRPDPWGTLEGWGR
jgi:acetyl/propionyl-CoA carboxylase alpha subunit